MESGFRSGRHLLRTHGGLSISLSISFTSAPRTCREYAAEDAAAGLRELGRGGGRGLGRGEGGRGSCVWQNTPRIFGADCCICVPAGGRLAYAGAGGRYLEEVQLPLDLAPCEVKS